MNSIRPIALVLAVTALTGALTSAQAQGLTREQVRAELAAAILNGDMIADYQTMQTYRELAPHRYPVKNVVAGKTRQEVRNELAEAVRTGNILGDGDQGLTAYDLAPHRYPAKQSVAGKTREEVRAELALALRLGDAPVNELGLTPAQQSPARFAAAIEEHKLAQRALSVEQSALRTVQDNVVR